MAPTTQSTSIYDLDYFDPCQMFIYIGDTWVDEITSFQHELQQSKTPIFGYASQLWDDLAAGQVLVSGSFTINFKEQGYLWAVLRRYWNMSLQATQNNGGSTTNLQKAVINAGGKSPIVWNGKDHDAIARQDIARQVQGNEMSRGQKYQAWVDLAGYATSSKKVKNPKDARFEDLMDVYENAVWNNTSVDDLNAQIRRPDCNVYDGLTIYQVFGNYNSKAANHTVQRFDNVALTSQGKMIRMGDAPIQESYTFLAQTLY